MLTTGTTLQNRYRIVSLLGQGGMGAVYRAWDTRLKGPVALKEMTPQPGLDAPTLAQLRQQFEQEAVVLARLNHPHLVRVTDFFEEWGNAYLVMDFVEGESLADRIEREGALSEDQVLEWADQLLDALEYCHAQGIIHRDVKPQNVIIRSDGRAVLVDFGLVKLWDPNDPHTRTAMRGMGTPEYAPPEQYGIQPGHTDPRSDIYSLGAMLYHALTGQTPLTVGDRMADPGQFVPVRGWNRRVSPRTEAAVLQAMELPRGKRFQSAQEMAAALAPGLAPPPPPQPAPAARGPSGTSVIPAPPAVRPRGAIPTWAWALGAIVLVGVVIWLALMAGRGGGESAPVARISATPSPPVTTVPTATPPEPTVTPTQPPSPTSPPTLGGTEGGLGDTWTRPADGMVMVYVPAGEFEMGSTEGHSDEQPVHTVALDGFWIDRTEVTNGQFAAFLNERGNQTEGGVTWLELEDEDCLVEQVGGEYQPRSGYDDHPVIEVSWYGAVAYCEWAGARLPTEAEWEYAARSTDGRKYPWGDSAPDCNKAQYSGCSGRTVPVGGRPAGASPYGALDLAGNVWEWVADWYGDYPDGAQTNPTGPATGHYKVWRGGSFGNNEAGVRAAYRSVIYPGNRFFIIGFRCVSGAPGQ